MGEVTDAAVAVTAIEVEGVVFPPSLRPPGSLKTHFLAGAGVRGIEIQGKFIAFTSIGVYLEEAAVQTLAGRWAGKAAPELAASPDFYRGIYSGEFEKFTKVTMVKLLTGEQYAEKVTENCVNQWKAAGVCTADMEAAAAKFREVCKLETFPPGASIAFTHTPSGLTVTFMKDESLPEEGSAVIESRALSEAILESIIGENGVSPPARRSLADRLPALLNKA